jgi:hypothetical protein
MQRRTIGRTADSEVASELACSRRRPRRNRGVIGYHRTMRTCIAMLALLGVACSNGDGGTTGFAESAGTSCTPGVQQSCPCAGGAPDGVQVCAPTGDAFGACMGCAGGSEGSSGTSEGSSGGGTGESSGAGSSTDPTLADSSSDGGVATPYVIEDCLVDTPRNGSEVCDDTGFTVEADAANVLVCLEATGGQIYISTNTAIDPTDGAARCSGWELNGQNAWDYLDYVGGPLTCDAEQKTLAIDLSPWVGQTLYIGAHEHPNGGGGGTTACMAHAK